jgi:hypothetical protein
MKIVEREKPQAKGCWNKINKQISINRLRAASKEPRCAPRKWPIRRKFLCYNRSLPGWRYRLGVRTEDSQSSNTGSIPVSATNLSCRRLGLCNTSGRWPTPSDVQVSEGEHTVSVKKAGFQSWERKLKVSAGSNIHLNAEFEKASPRRHS